MVVECLLAQNLHLVQELAGSTVGPQIMIYYGPDFFRMGLGEDLKDKDGLNMRDALEALGLVYQAARRILVFAESGNYQYQLNVSPLVSAIKKAGKEWRGGEQLKELCQDIKIKNNSLITEGIVEMP